jgi:hypothetical protein
LVGLQRYNRARMVWAADRFLARGHGFRSGYRNWAGLDQRALRRYHAQATVRPGLPALVGRAKRPASSPFALARGELDRIVAGSELGRRQRRQVRQAIDQAEERYWGRRITDSQTDPHVGWEVERLAAAALRAGVELDGNDLLELAAHGVRWRRALDRFSEHTNPAGHRIKRAAIANLLARAPPELHDSLLESWGDRSDHSSAVDPG